MNRTKVEVAFQRYLRSCRWREFWESRALSSIQEEEREEEECVQSIFRDNSIKTNFPRKHPCPPRLQEHLNAVYAGIVGAELNHYNPNLTKEEWEAIGSLKEKQSSKQIIIKPNDKTGGCSILDYNSYVDAMKVKLCEQYTNARGETAPKYEPVKQDELRQSW